MLGLVLEYCFPLAPHDEWLPGWLRATLAAALLFAGLPTVVGARLTLMKAKTNVSPLRPSTYLVVGGPFRWSRNPMYLGINLVLLGISLALRLYWVPLLMPALLTICHHGVVLKEEAYLEEKFGTGYLNYKARVRRWL